MEVDFVVISVWGYYRLWTPTESNSQLISRHRREQELQVITEDCTTKKKVW